MNEMNNMNKLLENNQVTLSGEIASAFTYNHEVFGEKFYQFSLKVTRDSGVEDILPIIVSERLIDVSESLVGLRVSVNGQFRSYNLINENERRLILSVFAREIEEVDVNDSPDKDNNCILLDGYICKQPTYRVTPKGRDIADVILAVNRPYSKSDYIPCIFWGRTAKFVGNIEIGKRVKVFGRIQSRVYQKRYSDSDYVEERTAYEVSAFRLEVVEDEEKDY